MNTNNSTTVIPPRGAKGRFLRSVPVATFNYWKADGGVSSRRVAVNPTDSMGNYISGIDLARQDYRTFRRSSIVGEIEIGKTFLDTVTLKAYAGGVKSVGQEG